MEAVLFGFGVFVLKVLPEKLIRDGCRMNFHLIFCTEAVQFQCGGGDALGLAHLVCLGGVHAAVGVVVHQFVDAADRLKAEQRVLVVTELLVYDTQVCNTSGLLLESGGGSALIIRNDTYAQKNPSQQNDTNQKVSQCSLKTKKRFSAAEEQDMEKENSSEDF